MSTAASLFVFSFIAFFIVSSAKVPNLIRGRPKGGMLGSPPRPANIELPPDQWVVQKLNHFDEADTRVWKQRYIVNSTFYKPGGPVFLMIGGEGALDAIWLVLGQWVETYAPKYGAMCISLEHRYYGKSHPTPDLSVENLQYLSSEQALADLAYFQQEATVKFHLEDSKWISFGGSYPGSLSAWYRLKYPHLVHGAIATSAPMFAKTDFQVFMDVVHDSLILMYGDQCIDPLVNVTATVGKMFATAAGRQQLKDMFQLCTDVDISALMDIFNIYVTLAGNFVGVVQYNRDNRAFEGAVASNITITTLCDIMTDASIGAPIERYAAVNTLILKAYKQPCVDFSYDEMIDSLKNTSWESDAAEGGRQWIYQTCTEFGFFQTSDSKKQPFGIMFPLAFYVQQCMDIYGEKFNKPFINAAVNATNINYGGYGIEVSNVLFLNGNVDPWHALGITNDLSPVSPAILINAVPRPSLSKLHPYHARAGILPDYEFPENYTGTAHCANMYPTTPNDPPQLLKARQQIEDTIGGWLK